MGHNGVHDIEGNELPRLVYVSREKRLGFEHHKKAGAMNALVEISNFSGISYCVPYLTVLFWMINEGEGVCNHNKCPIYIEC